MISIFLSLLKHKKIKRILSDLMIVEERAYQNFTDYVVISKTGVCHCSLIENLEIFKSGYFQKLTANY